MTSKPSSVPQTVQDAVLMATTQPTDGVPVKGYDFNKGVNFPELLQSLKFTGFQATNIGMAIDEINRMRTWRLSDDPIKEDDEGEWADPAFRAAHKCKIYLAYTSNMISSGVRETIRFLVEHKMVDVVVTSAGGIEEDFMKTMAQTYVGSFNVDDKNLRRQGINRLGNLLVPNSNYCRFEDWVTPILDKMHEEQMASGQVWTPSSIIRRLGLEINHPESVYYWAAKNDIPVFCPALTDGALGDMLYFHSFNKPGLVVDLVGDIKKINDTAVFARRTGMIILGGGVVKHHTLNANLMRNGADYAVFINTGQEFDGSDSGARPEEAFSWGKIRQDAVPIKISGDASYIFPLIVSMTFASDYKPKQEEEEKKAAQ